MKRIIKQLWKPLTLSTVLLTGCAGSGPAGDDSPPVGPDADVTEPAESFFSPTNLVVIRTSLGVLPAMPQVDPTNQYADNAAAAVLGQKFYFEDRYSSNGQVSCATCHDPDAGFQDDRANTSMGLGFTGRHAPTVINAAYGDAKSETVWNFWDGRKDNQWSQALGPPESAVEMGGTRTGVALLIFDKYKAEYEAVFGTMPALRDGSGVAIADPLAMPGTDEWDALDSDTQNTITSVYVNFGKAISAYERKIISRSSKYDRFLEEIAVADDSDIFTEQEKLGLQVFVGKGRCTACHRGPNLTDGDFYNIAVDQAAGDNLPLDDSGREAGKVAVLTDEFNCTSSWSDHPSKGDCAVANTVTQAQSLGAFKTPGLRDVSHTAPYMHTC